MPAGINYQILRDSISAMIQEGYTYYDITEESGVHNIKRIETGKNTPKITSWLKLNSAFPNHIPRPVHSDGAEVMQTIGSMKGKNISNAGRNIIHNNPGSDYSAEEQTLINIIRSKENAQKLIIDLITQVAREQ